MCKLVRVLYVLLPLDRFRAYLIRKHFAECSRCGLAAAEAPGWAALLKPPDWISHEAGFWPEVERLMAERPSGDSAPRQAPLRRPLAGLAAAVGGVLAVAALVLLLGKRPPAAVVAAVGSAPRVEVLSAEVEGRPARASIYQTKRASFIWFSRTPRKEG